MSEKLGFQNPIAEFFDRVRLNIKNSLKDFEGEKLNGIDIGKESEKISQAHKIFPPELKTDLIKVKRQSSEMVSIEIPFLGNNSVFESKASQFDLSPPRFELGNGFIFLKHYIKVESDGQKTESFVKDTVNRIRIYLGYAKTDIESFNSQIKSEIESELLKRKELFNRSEKILNQLSQKLRGI